MGQMWLPWAGWQASSANACLGAVFDEVVPVGVDDGLDAFAHNEFGQDVGGNVGLDGLLTHKQRGAISALLRPSASRTSTSCSRAVRVIPRRKWLRAKVFGQRGGESPGHGRVDDGVAAGHNGDGVDQFFRR